MSDERRTSKDDLATRLDREQAEEFAAMRAELDAEFAEAERELTVTIPLTAEQRELLNDPAAIEYLRSKLEEAYIGSMPEALRVLFE